MKAMAARLSGVTVGMEFEMYVPNVESGELEPNWEPDYEYDGYINTGSRNAFRKDVAQFFSSGDFATAGKSYFERIIDRDVYTEFQSWLDDAWQKHAEEEFSSWWEENHDADEAEPEPGTRDYDRAMGEFRDAAFDEWANDGDKINDWLEDEGIDKYRTFGDRYGLDWPHMIGELDLETVANDFSDAVGMPVKTSSEYHGRKKPGDAYMIEPDSSLDSPETDEDSGLEFVSPPLSLTDMIDQLHKVKDWAGQFGCYTNRSTGLHINVSMPSYSMENLDYVKLALFLGDEWVSDQFGQLGNSYARSAMEKIRENIRSNQTQLPGILSAMKSGLSKVASKIIHSGETNKYTSINTKDNRIEFRSPGGDWLDADLDRVINTMLRFVVAMDIALDPKKEQQEYAKKFYKLMAANAKTEDLDTLKYFAQYASGSLPKTALKSFVRNIQQKRQEKKNPPQAMTKGGTEVYNIVRIPDELKVHEFLAKDLDHAIKIKDAWLTDRGLQPANYRLKHITNEENTYRISYETPTGDRSDVDIRADSRREAHDSFMSMFPLNYSIVGFTQI